MTDHFYIASRLTKIQHTEAELAAIRDFLQQLSGDQDAQSRFFQYCKQWKLAPWAYAQLSKLELLDPFSEQTRSEFESAYQTAKAENEARNAEAVKFLTEFKKENIEVAILKGNLFIHTVYHDTGYKKMNDFDILIHPEDWERIQDVYLRLGYLPLGFGWAGEKEKPAKFSHTGMSFISPNFKCIVGSQWGLKSPTTHYKVDIREAWRTARDFDFCGVQVKQLSPVYNLLHLVLHMGIYKCGIRDCMDVSNLLLTQDALDEAEIIRVFTQSNAIEKAYFTLMLTQLCSGAVSESLLARLKPTTPGYHTRHLDARLKAAEQSGDMQVSYNDYFQDIEKEVIYFQLFPQFHRKAVFYYKIHRDVFFPKNGVALKLADQAQAPTLINRIGAQWRAPGRVLGLVAQEIGWKFTILLLVKLSFDLVASLKNYWQKKESYFDFLRRRGISPRAIEQVVKGIQ